MDVTKVWFSEILVGGFLASIPFTEVGERQKVGGSGDSTAIYHRFSGSLCKL